jgi:hypothetical protein
MGLRDLQHFLLRLRASGRSTRPSTFQKASIFKPRRLRTTTRTLDYRAHPVCEPGAFVFLVKNAAAVVMAIHGPQTTFVKQTKGICQTRRCSRARAPRRFHLTIAAEKIGNFKLSKSQTYLKLLSDFRKKISWQKPTPSLKFSLGPKGV